MNKVLPPKTAKEVMARERERKARTTLLMALPEDHLAKFHKMADKKEMFQTLLSQLEIHGAGVSHEDVKQKFLRSLPSFWSQVALIMRTKPGLDTLSFVDLYNNLRVFVMMLKQINDADMEEMDLKWQVAMISMRIKKFHKRIGRKFGKRDAGYNGNKARYNGRIPAYQDDSKALVTIDGEDSDWSGHVEEDTQNYAMMAYSSSNLGSDNETLADESDSKPGENAFCESDSSVETPTSMPELVDNASKVVCKLKVWADAPIIEEYVSHSDNDLVSNVQE
nr:hypothetical protein [Tanacetum cinerariifolium]